MSIVCWVLSVAALLLAVGVDLMTPDAPQSGAATTSLPVVAPDTSRTGWESVSAWFEEHFMDTRERT